MFIKENIFKEQSSKYNLTHVFKRKKFSDKRGGGGGEAERPGPTPKSALGNNMCNVASFRSFTYALSCFLSFLKNLYKSLLMSVFLCGPRLLMVHLT